MTKKKQSFEEALERLEVIVHEIETWELTIDNLVKLYNEGFELAALCGGKLSDAIQQVTVLKTTLDGQIEEKAFRIREQMEEEQDEL